MGIKPVLSAPRPPWQRAYVERVIGTIRRECLDHVIVFSEAGLYPTSGKSWTIIIGVARTWACRRKRPSHAPFKHQKPVGSSRAGSIILANVVPPEPLRVESQQ
jgi:hypothetical protein